MAKTFQMHFDMGNDAFRIYGNIAAAEILREIAEKIEQGLTFGPVKDVNGNTVGKYSISVEDHQPTLI